MKIKETFLFYLPVCWTGQNYNRTLNTDIDVF